MSLLDHFTYIQSGKYILKTLQVFIFSYYIDLLPSSESCVLSNVSLHMVPESYVTSYSVDWGQQLNPLVTQPHA